MEPLIRWAGSKRKLLRKLRAYCPQDMGRYIEPFAGSACLFFHLEPAKAIIGDLNWELVVTMRALQHDAWLVLEHLRILPVGKTAYYFIRSMNPRTLPEASMAARFLYLNHYCFNGLYRTNTNGRFNVPYGPPKNAAPIDETLIMRSAAMLKQARILLGDFEATVSYARRNDFVYLDPPYAVTSRRIFREYLPGSFSSKDLGRLGEVLTRLDDVGAAFLITYADSPEARRLLARWSPRRIVTQRNFAGFVGSRRASYELVASNRQRGVLP